MTGSRYEKARKTTVTFTIGPHELRMFNQDMKRVVEPGLFDIMARPNSVDLKSVVLDVTG